MHLLLCPRSKILLAPTCRTYYKHFYILQCLTTSLCSITSMNIAKQGFEDDFFKCVFFSAGMTTYHPSAPSHNFARGHGNLATYLRYTSTVTGLGHIRRCYAKEANLTVCKNGCEPKLSI